MPLAPARPAASNVAVPQFGGRGGFRTAPPRHRQNRKIDPKQQAANDGGGDKENQQAQPSDASWFKLDFDAVAAAKKAASKGALKL